MKIGLLTYHHSVNYGAVLQSYATAKVLREMGHEVTFINVRQPEKKSILNWAYYFRDRAFCRFIKEFYPPETKLIRTINELETIARGFDCLMVGSDQTWNPLISKDKYQAYFLNYGNPEALRISYASSFGFTDWPKEISSLKPTIEKALGRFDAVSVRELSGKKLLKRDFNIDAQVVLDPTMLISSYEDITGSIANNNSLCCYILNRTDEQLSFIRNLGCILGKKPTILNNILPVKGCQYVYPPSIKDWLKCIGGADVVVTDSFHGLVFCLLYNKNFIIVTPQTDRISRLRDLVKELNLENRFFTSAEDALNSKVWESEIDYDIINQKIDSLRKESIRFLQNSLMIRNKKGSKI